MKMSEILELQNFYLTIKDTKLPLKTAYKLTRLMRRVAQETEFYANEFSKIVDEYGKKENGQLVYTEDQTSIQIIPGKEIECNIKINELRDLEVDLSEFVFTIEEFEGIDLTLNQMNILLPLIKN